MPNYKALFTLLMLIAGCDLRALTVGSDTAVSVEAFTQFPEAENSTNEMLGFSSFANGFGLATENTTCTFNDFFPVQGPIFLNGGTVNLQQNLIFSSSAQIWTGGRFDGHNRSIIFQDTHDCTVPAFYGTGVLWPLTSVGPKLTGVQTVGWSFDDNFVFGCYWSSRYIYFYSFAGNKLISKSSLTLASNFVSAVWHPTEYYFALGLLAWGGAELRTYSFNPSTGALTAATLVDEVSNVNSLDWSSTGSYLLVGRGDEPYLKLYSFDGTLSLVTSLTGYPIATNSLSWNSDSTYFVEASTDASHGLTIYSFDGDTITEAVSLATDVAPICVDWSLSNSYIAVGFNTSNNWLRIYQFTPPATLTEVVTYPGTSGTDISINWNSDGTKLVTTVNSGSIKLQILSFDSLSPALSLVGSYDLNGWGTQSRWAHSDCYLLYSGYTRGWFTVASTCAQDGLIFKDAAIQLNGDIYLNAPFSFEGANVIDGKGCNMYLGDAGSIVVDSGSSLLLKDLKLYNVTDSNVSCVDEQSTLSFSGVVWDQDSDVTFTQGKLEIIGDLFMTGSTTFNYLSDQLSTVFDYGAWHFGDGMTFNYQPASADNNLIHFTAFSSMLHFSSANLYAPTGLQIGTSCLMIEGPCHFIAGESQAESIWFGDGNVKILPESGIIMEQGYVLYKSIS